MADELMVTLREYRNSLVAATNARVTLADMTTLYKGQVMPMAHAEIAKHPLYMAVVADRKATTAMTEKLMTLNAYLMAMGD